LMTSSTGSNCGAVGMVVRINHGNRAQGKGKMRGRGAGKGES
jgi:hypothetical protein